MKNLLMILMFLLQFDILIISQTIEVLNSNCCSYPVYAVDINPRGHYSNYQYAASSGCEIRLYKLLDYEPKVVNLFGHDDHISSIQFSPDGRHLVSGGYDNTIIIWDLILAKPIHKFSIHDNRVNQVIYSNNGSLVASCGKDGKINIIDVRKGELIHTLLVENEDVNSIAFDTANKLIICGTNLEIKIWDLEELQMVKSLKNHQGPIKSIKIYNDSLLFSASEDMTINMYDFNTYELLKTFHSHTNDVTSLAIATDSCNNSYLVSSSRDESIRLWDINKQELVKVIYNKRGGVLSLASSNSIVISGSDDKSIKFLSINSMQNEGELFNIKNSDFIIKSREQYFIASKNAYPHLKFSSSLSNIPNDIIEIKLNRPDIILTLLNQPDEISFAFRKAYQKRLLKENLKEDLFVSEFNSHWPKISFNKTPPTHTEKKKIWISYKAESDTCIINYIVVNINGVDILYPVNHIKNNVVNDSILIELSNEKNLLKLSTVNDQGTHSKSISANITYTGNHESEELYIVSIGASQYLDSAYNLESASLDALKIKNQFSSQTYYKNIHKIVLLDTSVVKEKIRSLKERLLKTKVDDQVLVFYSGHGLLDHNYDYYLSTYNMDFNKPEINGLKYDDLYNLLADIPARKKIIFLDASYLGEVNQEELIIINNETQGYEKLKGAIIIDSARFNFDSFEILKRYFPFQHDKNGINVITATEAGGNNFIFEIDNESVFTKVIINTVLNRTADTNSDKKITIDEFMNQITNEIKKLTNGMQNPTFIKRGKNSFEVFHIPERNDFSPPTIAILNEEFKKRGAQILVVDNSVINLKGVAIDDSGIKYLMVGNQRASIDSENRFEIPIALSNGENSINIVAEDIYGNHSKLSYEIISTNNTYNEFGKYFALIIGVTDYQNDDLDLEFPVDDAIKVKQMLTNRYIFDSINISFLKNPDRNTILKEFGRLRKTLNENDNLFIFYAGHGHYDKDMDQGFWWPSDADKDSEANWVSNSVIRDYIRAIKAKHILLISDACFSGQVLMKKRDPFSGANASTKETYKMNSRRAITSGALETVPDKSVFVAYLLDYLNSNEEKFLYSKKLYLSIKDPVTNNSPNRQRPLDGVISDTGDKNGDFIFIKREK